jgi:hypothetical protein
MGIKKIFHIRQPLLLDYNLKSFNIFKTILWATLSHFIAYQIIQ